MAIRVRCPNGHLLKVKDKYAGKKGLCPLCEDQVVVEVPPKLTEDDIVDLLAEASEQKKESESAATVFEDAPDAESVLDHSAEESSAMSLVSASAARQLVRCPHCSGQIPFWSTKCPLCGEEFHKKRSP